MDMEPPKGEEHKGLESFKNSPLGQKGIIVLDLKKE